MRFYFNKIVGLLFLLSFFTVLSQWGFWGDGVYALGLNTSLSGIAFIVLLVYSESRRLELQFFSHLLPVILVLFSLFIYENPWLKLISIAVLPLMLGVAHAFRNTRNNNDVYWNEAYLTKITCRLMEPFHRLGYARKKLLVTLMPNSPFLRGSIAQRFSLGLLILLPLSIVVLILLCSVDDRFAELINRLLDSFFGSINIEVFLKVFFVALTMILLMAVILAWQRVLLPPSREIEIAQVDSVSSGVVIGGLLMIYLLFLAVQIEHLMVDSLPIDLGSAEHLVKSGFWQMFLLSIINVVLFYKMIDRTNGTVRSLLAVFIVSSCLLAVSACWRLVLYVYYYGLSYEKFFASYTAIYTAFVFVTLGIGLTVSKRQNVLRLLVMSAIWFYSVAAVLPIERIIFKTNLALAEHAESRIELVHLTFLSLDVYGLVTAERERGGLQQLDWDIWMEKIQVDSCGSDFLETNLTRLIHCSRN